MSIRCSGVASRSFIIGSRLWPPAMTRASAPSRWSASTAPSTLVARSYWNGAGVCTVVLSRSGALGREPPARGPDVLAPLVLLGGARPDDRGARQLLRARVPDVGVQGSGGEAAALDVAEHARAGARGGDRGLAPEPRERQRPLGVDLADPRRDDLRALREVAQTRRRRAGIQAVDEADGILEPGLLDEQALERRHARVELLVDGAHDVVDRRALLHDAADVHDHLVEAR